MMTVVLRIRSFGCCLVLIGLCSLPAEAVRENPLFDAYYTSIGFKAEKVRLNNYAIQLKNGIGSRGLIVVYAESERTVKSAQRRARAASSYVIKRGGLKVERVRWRYERACGRELILLYLMYPNEADPTPDPKCRSANNITEPSGTVATGSVVRLLRSHSSRMKGGLAEHRATLGVILAEIFNSY